MTLVGCLAFAAPIQSESRHEDFLGWQRIDSRYCTIWLDPGLAVKRVNRRVRTWGIRPTVKIPKGETPDGQLAAKCDTIFRRAEELLDMYPPGIHVTIKVASTQEEIQDFYAARYGHGTEAIAFYVFENNTIYTTGRDISAGVLAHEMAHCIIDHYFGVRPPRKIEELLAMYVDAHLGD